MVWRPGALTRSAGADRLTLLPADPAQAAALGAGERRNADVAFTGDRHKSVSLTVAATRALPTLLHRSVQPRTGPATLR
ncbi:MAG: hypothetical protein PGN08_14635 [Sphingomonas taxi]